MLPCVTLRCFSLFCFVLFNVNVHFFRFKEKRNRPGCPTVDVGKRLCRYRPAEGERAEFLLIHMYFAIREFFYRGNFVGLKRYRLDLESDLPSGAFGGGARAPFPNSGW